MDAKKDIIWRVTAVYLLILVFAIIIVSRILYLQIAEHDKWNRKSTDLTEKTLIIEPNRGDICASDGRLLSSSVPLYEIRMDLICNGLTEDVFNNSIDSLSYYLSNLFKDKTQAQYKQELKKARQAQKRYHLIRRQATYIELKKLKQFPIYRLGQNSGGLIVVQLNKRVKPFLDLASRTIGQLYETKNGIKEGQTGIEGAFNSELKGVQGIRLMQRLAGNIWMPINDGNEVEPKDGYDVITTIDVNIQDVAESALYEQLKKNNAQYGTAILMEVETGEIKAIANLKLDTLTGQYHELYNFGIGASTEPGSTFKLATLMVAFEDGYVNLEDSIETGNGVVKYYDHVMKDSHEGGYGKITVQEIFEKSSNVGVSKIITEHYTGKETQFVNRLYKMNLNEMLDLEIKGEGKPYIKSPEDSLWSGVSLPQMSIGYEVKLTPLQILTFYNAVANNGKMLKPIFVKALRSHGKIIKTFESEIINPSICSIETIEKAKKMLEGVVEKGTATNIKNATYKIAGKTGTAKIANKKLGYQKQYQASFCGYFPADNPKYSCIVVVNAPSNDVYYGNVVAGPVFREIADKVYATSLEIHPKINELAEKANIDIPHIKYGDRNELTKLLDEFKVPYKNDNVNSKWVVTQYVDSMINIANRVIRENYVPNVKGMGAKDATFILENLGLNVSIIGRGSVYRQSINPNEPIIKGQKITIELS
ncbi:MAG: hypothetical protein A2W98_13455 [Bacteroidetes bacterium GWF2_33_38]|nr:MAG: hypothetical protein A2W98_13455 [Bacteroidetes bacterium GWF2_33_38]OFY73502.1 MAG: hypothetical protein A2265_10060 [Bacteroidetes bacterium RIFOXYA12_FULL_33_9]OFY88930.1 MAG: hypothetical protein A2236_07310 [Bacteroidetes bacterium RIFOXYA2_FULL_33_7]